jgi:D-alanyl-D-alanine carboxypeptidase
VDEHDLRRAVAEALPLLAGVPGVVVAVEDSGTTVTAAAGSADLATGEELTPAHAFRAASVTKLLTAALGLRLAERGHVDLDAPIAAVLPPEVLSLLRVSTGRPGELTVRRLLGHTAGLADPVTDPRFEALLAADPARRWQPRDLLRLAAQWGEPPGAPGAGLHYSDTGYVVAGLLFEEATGEPLHALYRAHLLEPAGAAHTWLETREPGPDLALSHHYAGGTDLHGVDMSWDWAGGGLATTAADLSRLTRHVLAGPALSPASRRQLTAWSPHPYRGAGVARYERYGLGVGLLTIDGVALVGATGSWGAFGFQVPGRDLTVAGTVNALGVDRTPLLRAVLGTVGTLVG